MVNEIATYLRGWLGYFGDCQTPSVLLMESVTHFITHRLKLKVNQAKSAVARPGQRKFLGFSFTSERKPRRRIASKAIVRFTKS
jgi:hypothetical protein